jgi:nicotinamidase-related amidase
VTATHPALVVVDIQNGFVRDASRHVVPVISGLVDRWQQAGLDVVFTRYFNFSGSQFERLFGWTGLQGPPETDIAPQLAEQASHATAIVDKQIDSLFTTVGTELVRRHGWTDLYICGIATESCVLKTARGRLRAGRRNPVDHRGCLGEPRGPGSAQRRDRRRRPVHRSAADHPGRGSPDGRSSTASTA